MSGLIPQRFVEDLLDRIDLAELIGSRITLKKAGGNYKARCPFHDEKRRLSTFGRTRAFTTVLAVAPTAMPSALSASSMAWALPTR